MHPLIKHRLQGEGQKPAKISDIAANVPAAGDSRYADLKRVFTATGSPLATITPPSTTRIDWYTGFPILPLLEGGKYYLLFWFNVGIPAGANGLNVGLTFDVQAQMRTTGGSVWHRPYTTVLGTVPSVGLGAGANVKGSVWHYGFASMIFESNWLDANGPSNTSACSTGATWERTVAATWLFQLVHFTVSNTNFQFSSVSSATRSEIPDMQTNSLTVNPYLTSVINFQLKLQAGPIAITAPLTEIRLERVDILYGHGPGFYS